MISREFAKQESGLYVPVADETAVTVVVDISSRCDMDCPGCMVFHLQDTSYRDQPVGIEDHVTAKIGERIGEYAKRHNTSEMDVILFGGEPLVRGAAPVRSAVTTLQRNAGDTELRFRTTTNGRRLGKDAELRDTLEELEVGTTISLDGYKAVHDTTRLNHDGSGTYDEVTDAIDVLRFEHPRIYSGLLCTLIDPASDPVLTHRTLSSFRPPAMDYLLDHGRARETPPEMRGANHYPYGEWLIGAFQEWLETPTTEPLPEVRLFRSIMNLFEHDSETAGSVQVSLERPWATLSIGTDGSIRNDPGLNGAYDGAASTGMNVLTHSFDQALQHPSFAHIRLGKAGLSKTCQDCYLVDKCGGGFPAHRYWNPDPKQQPTEYIMDLFNYPSAYCSDMQVLINYIGRCLAVTDSSSHAG
jgi:uncharacterized protein